MNNNYVLSLSRRYATSIAVCSGMCLLPLSGLAGAQQSDSKGGGNIIALEEVIVTAERKQGSLQDTPIAISAFGEDQLEVIGVNLAMDIAKFVPNMHMSRQTGSFNNYQMSIRGVSNGEISLTAEQTVGIYQDGIYIARSTGAALELVDLERIEVLRGPQGTLYGRNTIGGAINLISKKPASEFGFKQQFTAGNDDLWLSRTSLDTGENWGLSARLSYLRTAKDGQIQSINGGASAIAYDNEAYRLALRWEPSDDWTIDYTFDHNDSEGNSTSQQLTYVRPSHTAVGGAFTRGAAAAADQKRRGNLPLIPVDDDFEKAELDAHSLTVEWRLDNVAFKYIWSTREFETNRTGSTMGFAEAADGVTLLDSRGGVVPAGTIVSIFGNPDTDTNFVDYDQDTHELQAIGSLWDDKLDFTVGLYYFEESGSDETSNHFVMPALYAFGGQTQVIQSFLCQDPTFSNPMACFGKDAHLLSYTYYKTDVESVAAYGQFTYHATDDLAVTLGMRYTEDDKDAWANIPVGLDFEVGQGSDSWDNFSTSLTLDYQWNDDISTYFSFSQGYRAGGFNARARTVSTFEVPFDAEEVDSYELGFKTEWMNQRLRLNGAVFFFEYSDRQVNQYASDASGGGSIVSNAGKSETLGFELELVALPMEGLMINATLGIIDQDYTEFFSAVLDPATGFPVRDETGAGVEEDISDFAKFPYAPEETASLAINYEFRPFSFGTLSANISATYRSEIYHHAQLYDISFQDDVTLVNARVSLLDIPVGVGDLQVAAWGKNITNEKYREFGIDFAAIGFKINNWGELSTWGVDVIYEY